MYNLDITSIVKTHVVPNGRLKEAQIMFIDFEYEDEKEIEVINPFSPYSPMVKSKQTAAPLGIKVFTKNLADESMKNSFLSNTDDIFEEILNCYYEMYLNGTKNNDRMKLEYKSEENNVRKLIGMCTMASNIIAGDCRRGPGNVIILPDGKYDHVKQIFGARIEHKVIINPTESHKDKIFVIRVDSDSSSPGLSLFLSRGLAPDRYVKLVKLMNKMGRNMDDLSFSYILSKVGFHPETFVQVVYLT